MTNERPENVWAATLPNGLRVRVLCKPDFQRSYAVLAACYGGADRRFRVGDTWTDTPAGVAHYLEHKLFDMPDGSDALTALCGNGASPNAFTSANMTAYYFSCTDHFEENLRTLLRFVSTPYFTDASVAKEQGIIAQEIRMGDDDPNRAVWRNLMRCLMARDGARDAVAGTVESIAQITPETLYTCHRAFYAPSNMVLCAVCQTAPERVAAIAGQLLPPELAPVPVTDHGAPEEMTPAEVHMRVQLAVSAPQMLLGAKFRPAQKGADRLRQDLTARLAMQAAFGRSSPFLTISTARGCSDAAIPAARSFAARSRWPCSAVRAGSPTPCTRASGRPPHTSRATASTPPPSSGYAAPCTASCCAVWISSAACASTWPRGSSADMR